MPEPADCQEMKRVFDAIAPGWYNRFHWTRFKDDLDILARRWGSGRLVNLGCAHGADFLSFKNSFDLYGVDISPKMLEQAEKYAAKFGYKARFYCGDVRNLPFERESFEWAIAVATYHHLKGPAEISRALAELYRVLKPGGEAFVTFWNRCQPRFWFKPRELQVPWKTGDETLSRYYYLVSFRQAETLAGGAGFAIIESSPEKNFRGPIKYFSKNICLLLKKPANGPGQGRQL